MIPMRTLMLSLLVITGVFISFQPAVADAEVQDVVIYQTNFAGDPHWKTNSPRSYYWIPEKGVYHYEIEPSTGAYAYVEISYDNGPFTFEYDVTPQSTEENSAFRFGLTKKEMLRTEGTVALTEFTNGKGGKLIWIRAVTPSNNLFEVSSYSFSYGEKTGAKTVNFVDNKTYHVVLEYDDERNMLTMRTYEKATGTQIWGYFLKTNEELRGMDRIALGPLGDFSSMGPVAEGYIDNVILTVKKTVSVVPTTQPTMEPAGTEITRVTIKPTVKPTTRAPTPEPTTPPALPTVLAALCILGSAAVWDRARKNR